jgi:multidrug efflux pump subunit AcrB
VIVRKAIAFQLAFEHRFTRIRDGYYAMLGAAMAHRVSFIIGFLGFVLISFALVPFLGRDFFPGCRRRLDRTACARTDGYSRGRNRGRVRSHRTAIRQIIPADQLDTVIDNIGLPLSSVNLVYSNTGTIGPQDGDIQIALKEGHRPPRTS